MALTPPLGEPVTPRPWWRRGGRPWQALLLLGLLWAVFFFIRPFLGHELGRWLLASGPSGGSDVAVSGALPGMAWRLIHGCAVLVGSTVVSVGVVLTASAPAGLDLGLGVPTVKTRGALVARGFVLGLLLLSLICLDALVTGNVRVLGDPAGSTLWWGLGLLALLFLQSSAEEVLLRGASQGLLAKFAGEPGAAVASAVLFAVLHGRNPSVTTLAVVNIGLVGLFLGLVRMHTGGLWATMGIHTGWNWCEAFVWGAPLSGFRIGTSLLQTSTARPALFSGGDFGPEASLWTTLLFALLSVALWPRRSGRGQGQTRRPGRQGSAESAVAESLGASASAE